MDVDDDMDMDRAAEVRSPTARSRRKRFWYGSELLEVLRGSNKICRQERNCDINKGPNTTKLSYTFNMCIRRLFLSMNYHQKLISERFIPRSPRGSPIAQSLKRISRLSFISFIGDGLAGCSVDCPVHSCLDMASQKTNK